MPDLPGYAIGDAVEVLRGLPDGWVQTCITSPPYWGLRNYGCEGQLGLEDTPEQYVDSLVEVFREVRRVLRDDGTLWLNLGDRYITRPNGSLGRTSKLSSDRNHAAHHAAHSLRSRRRASDYGLKHKDLVGLPWMVAFALRADGWYLRAETIWHKPSAMPESVCDRPSRVHEQVFLLAKSERYYYDAYAIRERTTGGAKPRGRGTHPKSAAAGSGVRSNASWSAAVRGLVAHRNSRSVWSIPQEPYSGAHFATFPAGLVRPMVLAGTSPKACGVCGAPWQRVLERVEVSSGGTAKSTIMARGAAHHRSVGWKPGCEHDDDRGRCVVLDPFLGTGTTGSVSEQLGRDWYGVELNPAYEPLIRERTAQGGMGL
jgi:DNA modification methylase